MILCPNRSLRARGSERPKLKASGCGKRKMSWTEKVPTEEGRDAMVPQVHPACWTRRRARKWQCWWGKF